MAFALLSDDDAGVIEAALRCLVQIGDERELIALDIWLRKIEKNLGKRCDYRDDYDRLKARLNPH